MVLRPGPISLRIPKKGLGKKRKYKLEMNILEIHRNKLLIIHRRARREEERRRFSFVINHNFLCLSGM
jgi:hypothetical protein